ncbi:DUF4271 domain-containing protein [Solitalea koreensis]|uniref:DUF4271 domain-containing protein n=1 Tax=Solitalea koreensis TaxID=543615 RepID=A0A521AUK8_9SPHI|nr:DUF4271 domain-containing protein [Solitalea koreensis]SMO38494.1 protein of unknown function [Solitalea koreensis]
MRQLTIFLRVFFLFILVSVNTLAQDSSHITLKRTSSTNSYNQAYAPKYKLDSAFNAYLKPIKLDSIRTAKEDSSMQVVNAKFFDYLHLKRKTAIESKNEKYQTGAERKFYQQWNVFALLSVLCLFVLISYFFAKDIYAILQGFINNRILNLVIRDNNVLNSESFLFIALFISLTYAYLLKLLFGIDELFHFDGWAAYVALAGCVMVFFGVKTILLRLAGALFSVKSLVNNYISIVYITFCAFSLIIFPLLIFYTLGPKSISSQLLIVFVVLLVLSLVYQYLRGILYISSNFQFPKFYFIVYLCAFEICPLIILYKVLLN